MLQETRDSLNYDCHGNDDGDVYAFCQKVEYPRFKVRMSLQRAGNTGKAVCILCSLYNIVF